MEKCLKNKSTNKWDHFFEELATQNNTYMYFTQKSSKKFPKTCFKQLTSALLKKIHLD